MYCVLSWNSSKRMEMCKFRITSVFSVQASSMYILFRFNLTYIIIFQLQIFRFSGFRFSDFQVFRFHLTCIIIFQVFGFRFPGFQVLGFQVFRKFFQKDGNVLCSFMKFFLKDGNVILFYRILLHMAWSEMPSSMKRRKISLY